MPKGQGYPKGKTLRDERLRREMSRNARDARKDLNKPAKAHPQGTVEHRGRLITSPSVSQTFEPATKPRVPVDPNRKATEEGIKSGTSGTSPARRKKRQRGN